MAVVVSSSRRRNTSVSVRRVAVCRLRLSRPRVTSTRQRSA
ncbi:hypothetical protein NP493_1413g00023 [Ridgeia piscesae]|uniref:Uncharacterized protein n=1 Tax=Ridgeia piscesae TaxID=27915 RepID=A0AAD9NDQ0_RIDPI|nr:hypothetical protein NP493_1413g00023 [Ridgeia piscesae]